MEHHTSYNDRELLEKISEGDEKAFAVLFNHYYPLLTPFVRRFTGSANGTEEVLQETFIRIWLYRDRITEISDLRAWIFKVSSRECLSALRKNLNDRRKLQEMQQSAIFHEEGATPADYTQLAEMTGLVNEAIRQMPAGRRRIYEMSRDEGLKPAEIARSLSLSVSTVKNVLSASLKEIREYLAPAGHRLLVLGYILFTSI